MNALSLTHVDLDLHLDQRERKFLPDAEVARAFWRVASAHLPREHDGGAVAYTRTTYFDTPDLAYYRSSRGPVKRRLRVREYGVASDADVAPVLSDRCFLELKQSAGNMRSKTRVALSQDEVAEQLARVSDAPLAPCVATWYRRRALVDRAQRLRITLDDRVLLCRPRPIGSALGGLDATDVLAPGPAFVLEYKSSEPPPAWLERALAELREATGFSKFTLGMDAVVRAREASHPCYQSAATG